MTRRRNRHELQPPTPTPNALRDPASVKARKAELVIRIMVDVNPYRLGTAAHLHFEQMRGGITVRQYLAKFSAEDHRTARQWLWNAVDAGHIMTLGG